MNWEAITASTGICTVLGALLWFIINMRTTQIEEKVDLKDEKINLRLDNLESGIERLVMEQAEKSEKIDNNFEKVFDKLEEMKADIENKYVTKENFHAIMSKD